MTQKELIELEWLAAKLRAAADALSRAAVLLRESSALDRAEARLLALAAVKAVPLPLVVPTVAPVVPVPSATLRSVLADHEKPRSARRALPVASSSAAVTTSTSAMAMGRPSCLAVFEVAPVAGVKPARRGSVVAHGIRDDVPF